MLIQLGRALIGLFEHKPAVDEEITRYVHSEWAREPHARREALCRQFASQGRVDGSNE